MGSKALWRSRAASRHQPLRGLHRDRVLDLDVECGRCRPGRAAAADRRDHHRRVAPVTAGSTDVNGGSVVSEFVPRSGAERRSGNSGLARNPTEGHATRAMRRTPGSSPFIARGERVDADWRTASTWSKGTSRPPAHRPASRAIRPAQNGFTRVCRAHVSAEQTKPPVRRLCRLRPPPPSPAPCRAHGGRAHRSYRPASASSRYW